MNDIVGQSEKFLKNSITFFVGSISSRIINFFLLPLYTKYISPSDFGYYDLSISYVTIATSILFLDIWVTTMRYMYDNSDIKWKYKVVASGYSIYSASSVLMIILAILLSFVTDIKYIFLIFMYAMSLNFHNMFTFPARGFGRNTDFSISGIINTIVTVIVNIILIIFLKFDYSALYIAAICGNLVQSIYLELRINIIRSLRIKIIDFELIKKMLIYTLPLCINSVAYWLLTSFNKIVINHVLTSEYNGYYAIGHKFGYAIALVTTCFTLAWQDLAFSRKIDDENNGSYYSKACKLYMLFLGVGVILLLSVFNILFPLFVDDAYSIAKATIPLFLITAMVSAYSTFVGNIFYALKNTKIIFVSMVISCIVNLLLCYPLIILWNLNGANLSIIISFIINIIIRNIILKKKIGFSFDYKLFILIAFGIGVSYIIYSFGNMIANAVWLIVVCIYIICKFRKMLKSIFTMLFRKRGFIRTNR